MFIFRFLLVQVVYLILSALLAHFVFSKLYRMPITQLDYLLIAFLAIFLYTILTRFHPHLYLEFFEIDPNITENNAQAYQENNYQQMNHPNNQQNSDGDGYDNNVQGDQINIFVDENMEENPVNTRWQPSFRLNQDDPNLKANALEKAPDTQQFTYDDGNLDNTPQIDAKLMEQIKTHIKTEVQKHYQNSLEDGNLTQLKPLIAQKLEERMPYLSTKIRQTVLDHLDPMIDQVIDDMLGKKPATQENRIQPLTIPPRNQVLTIPHTTHPLSIHPTTQPLSISHTIQNLQGGSSAMPYFPPTTYMENITQHKMNPVFCDHSSDNYQHGHQHQHQYQHGHQHQHQYQQPTMSSLLQPAPY